MLMVRSCRSRELGDAGAHHVAAVLGHPLEGVAVVVDAGERRRECPAAWAYPRRLVGGDGLPVYVSRGPGERPEGGGEAAASGARGRSRTPDGPGRPVQRCRDSPLSGVERSLGSPVSVGLVLLLVVANAIGWLWFVGDQDEQFQMLRVDVPVAAEMADADEIAHAVPAADAHEDPRRE